MFIRIRRSVHIRKPLGLISGLLLGLAGSSMGQRTYIPLFADVQGTQLTNTKGQWVRIDPAFPDDIDLVETKIFKMPQRGMGVKAVEFKLVGADGGTAHYKDGVYNSFANGGQGGEITYTLDMGKRLRWRPNEVLYGKPFIVTFGKKGESTTFNKMEYVSAGGGGSTGMSWLLSGRISADLNRKSMLFIAGAGGGGGAFATALDPFHGRQATGDASAGVEETDRVYATVLGMVLDAWGFKITMASGGSRLRINDEVFNASTSAAEDKFFETTGIVHNVFEHSVDSYGILRSITHGQKGGRPTTAQVNPDGSYLLEGHKNFSSAGGFMGNMQGAWQVLKKGGRGGAGLGGGGAGLSVITEQGINFSKFPTGGGGGTGSPAWGSVPKRVPNSSDAGWNDYFIAPADHPEWAAPQNVNINGSRTTTSNPRSGYMMYRTVAETEPPQINMSSVTITLKDYLGNYNYNPNVSIMEAFGPYLNKSTGLYDNDGIASVTASVYGEPLFEFQCFMAGQQVPVDLTVTDVAGNSATALVIVTVVDPVKPTVIGFESSPNPLDPDQPWRIDVSNGPVTLSPANFPKAWDGCKGNNNITIHFSPTTFYCNDVGEQDIEYYYTDMDGNSSEVYTKTFKVQCGTPTEVNQRYLYVDHTARGNNTGVSWNNAFRSLQDALNNPRPATFIYVAEGTYTPDKGEGIAVNDRSANFGIRENLKIYGGFPNGGSEFAKRNPETHRTILSGEIGDPGITTDNSHNVVYLTGNNTHFEGFTIEKGYSEDYRGAGMWIDQSATALDIDHKTVIRNCKFLNNRASEGTGGGVFIEYKNKTTQNDLFFQNCLFLGNSAHRGGGIYMYNELGWLDNMRALFTNCIFQGNTGDLLGGGAMFQAYADVLMINCTFSGNYAGNGGGAIYNDSRMKIQNSIVYGNESWYNIDEIDGWGYTQAEYSNIRSSNDWYLSKVQDLGNNISTDPLFASDPALSIQPESPCRDAGFNDYNTELYDIYGSNKRITMGAIDMGAFETSNYIVFVDADALAGGDGDSWSTAFNNLSDGIAAAGTGSNQKDIWVKAGRYWPDRLPGSTAVTPGNRSNSFYVSYSLKIYGGFAGNETAVTQRNIGQNPTILSGDIGLINNVSDNVYHVITMMAAEARLDGLIIEGGNASDPSDSENRKGGGVYEKVELAGGNNNVVVNCVFRNNMALEDGGAWYAGARVTGATDFVQTIFYHNMAHRGAVAFLNIAHANAFSYDQNFYNVTVGGNVASGAGAGAFEATELTGRPARFNFYNSVLAGNVPQNYNDSGNPGHTGFVHTYTTSSGTDAFINPSNPAGNDGKIMTADDGLQASVYSLAINYGDETWLYKGIDKDITGSSRVINKPDAGAYESDYEAPLQAGGSATVYVRPLVTGDGTGRSWENATSDLHNAIHTPGVQKVFVAIGRYHVGNHSFIMKNQVEIYGGFDPDKGITDLSHKRIMPDPTNNSPQSSVLDGQGVRPVIWNVFTEGTAMDRSAVLDGFMITNGKYSNGGGVRNLYASPVFKNIVIHTNRATIAGAGMFNSYSNPLLINVIINNNGIDARIDSNGAADVFGAGMYNTFSQPELQNVTLVGNYLFATPNTDAKSHGAGIYNDHSSPYIQNSIFWNNRKGFNVTVGGVDIENAGSVTLTLKNSIMQSYDTGVADDKNKLNTDPGFVDIGSQNFRLTAGSVAIDGGDNALFQGLNDQSEDIAGNARVFDFAGNKIIDIGAYEYQCERIDNSLLKMEEVSVVYDGAPHGVLIKNLPEGLLVTYQITDSLNNTFDGNTAVNAGIYTVTAIITPVISGVDCMPFVKSARLTIQKAPAVITASKSQYFVYDGGVKEVVASLNHTEAALDYFPQKGYRDAQVYWITISVPETANYLSASENVGLAIERADFTALRLDDTTFTYDGTPKALAIKGVVPPGTTVAYAGNDKTDAGTHNVMAYIQRPNYNDLNLSGTLTIMKAEAEIIADQVQTHVYDGTVKNVRAVLNHSDTLLSYTPQRGYTAAGTYPVIISAGETANYLSAADTVQLLIKEAKLSALSLDDAVFTYDGTPKSLAIQGTLPAGGTVSYSGNAKTNAGSYSVQALVQAPNYADSTFTAELEIRKAPGLIIADKTQTFVYDGTEKNATASLNHTETVLTYSPQRGYTAAGVYPVYISAIETANYLAARDTISLVIESAGLAGISFKDSTVIYDGTARSLLISGTLPQGGTVSYTGNGKTEAGVYTVEALIQVPNYSDVHLSATLTIEKAEAVITTDAVQHFTYDGTEKKVAASLNHSETALVYTPQQGYTGAGTYEVVITATATDNYLSAADTVSLVIESAGLSGISFKDSTVTYDGTPKSLAIQGTLPQGGSVSYSGNGNTDAGNYTVEALIQVPNYSDVRLLATLTIAKAPALITADPTQTFTYDGTEKKIVASLSHSETILTYAPQQGYTGVGSYPIILTAAETANYLAAADTVTLVIERAILTGITLPDGTFTYDGTSKSLAVSGNLLPSTTLDYTGNGKTDAGVYTVTALVRAPNYRDLNLAGTLTIKKAQAVITADQTQVFTYDGTEKMITASLNHTETNLTYAPQQGYTAAGSYPIIINSVETTNYLAAADTVTLVIQSSTVSGLSLPDASFTYDGTPKSLAVSGSLPQGATVSYTGNAKTNAGVYTVSALISAPNFQDLSLNGTLTIYKAPAVITADQVQTHVYDGTVKNVVASLNHSDASLSYLPQRGYAAAGTYPVIISTPETANYLAAADTVSLVIESAGLADISFKDSTFTYEGTPKSLAISGNLPQGGSVSYTGNGQTDAGEYTVEALIQVPNYSDVRLSAKLTIEKAEALIVANKTQTFTYDGTVKNAVASLNHNETALVYSPQKGYTAVGTYPIIITAEATSNYLATTDTVTLVIENQSVTGLALKDSTFTYDGTPKSLVVSGTLPVGATVSYTGNSKTNAGVYTVTARIEAPGVTPVNLSGTLTIEKAKALIAADTLQLFMYDGTVKNIVATLNHTETALTYAPQKGYSTIGSYFIRISAAETANYLSAADTVRMIIEKAGWKDIALKDSVFTYDGKAHALAVSKLPQGATVVYTNNGKTNAGVYKVSATVSMENYKDSVLTATLTILKAAAVITAQAVQEHTADGSLKQVTASLNHQEISLVYTPAKGYSQAGSYPITVSAAETKNYKAASVKVTLVIQKATFQGVSMSGAEYTYDGTARYLYVSGAPDGTRITYSGNGQSQSGTYTVRALLEKENYNDLELSAILVIRKAQSVIWTDAVQSHVYDGTLKAVQAWLNHSETVLSYSPQQGYTDAGTYHIQVSAPETRNYLAASTSVRLFIDKARFEGVRLADGEFTYNGTPHSLQVSGAPPGATVTYTGNGRTNAGTYSVNALVQMKNYYDLELSATLVIHKAPQYITFDDIELKHLEEDSDFQLMAHSSSGLPVSYTYTYDAEEAPATVTPAGWVELHTSGYVQIIAYQEGNENYLPAETVTRQLKINSSDATVHRITLGGEVTEAPDTDIYYLMDCGDEREELQVQLKTEVGATVVPGRDFTVEVPAPGIYTRSVVITSQDSTNTLTYQITIEKRFKFEQIGVQKFNNLFLINNNPETNGGYEFVEYEWYKNGELVGNGQYYSAGGNQSDVLDGQASYSVRMKTADGQWLSVCAFSYRPDASFTLSISPNPIISGNRLRLKVSEGGEARVRVLTSAGVLVLDQRIKDSTAGLTLPSELSAGTYILHYENGNIRKSVQFVLEK